MIKDVLAAALRDVLTGLGVDPIPATIELEQPARREHGDWSSNVALVSSKAAGRNPRDLATEVADLLNASPPEHVASVEIAGPGFVNFRLHDTWLHEVLADVIDAGDKFGDHDFGDDEHVNVEFVSANPNKPLHGGHARGATYGDAAAKLFEKCGYRVTREFYLNDRGVQMMNYAASLAAAKAGDPIADDGYHGGYIAEWAAEMPDDADPFEWGYARAVQSHKETLASIGVHHDVWFSERSLVADGGIEAALDELRNQNAIYDDAGATWLRTTDFGDDKDRVLIKSDGDMTYLTPDIAYHVNKFSRAQKLFNVWGADHHGYVSRVKAAMRLLGHEPDDLEIAITQMIKIMRDGEEMKMSGRAGTFVTIDEMVDEVGADAVRFTFLMQSMDTKQTIDLTALAEKSMDNPVFYVQYAHARISSLTKNATEAGVTRGELADTDLSLLTHERELEILRTLAEFSDVVAIACRERSPHKIITWVRELASAFHGFYHDCYVVGDGISPELTQARLWLMESARVGLVAGLDLVGVSAPEAM